MQILGHGAGQISFSGPPCPPSYRARASLSFAAKPQVPAIAGSSCRTQCQSLNESGKRKLASTFGVSRGPGRTAGSASSPSREPERGEFQRRASRREPHCNEAFFLQRPTALPRTGKLLVAPLDHSPSRCRRCPVPRRQNTWT